MVVLKLIKLLLLIFCVAPDLPPVFRCQYQAYADGKNSSMYAITVTPLDNHKDLRDFMNKQKDYDTSGDDVDNDSTDASVAAIVEMSKDVPCKEKDVGDDTETSCFNALDSQGHDLPPPAVPQGINTKACLSPKKPVVEELKPCTLGHETEDPLPCPEIPPENEAYKCVKSEIEVDECKTSHEEDSMVMVECRSCNARLNTHGAGVKLTCYDCQHQQGDKTCHFSKFDPTFKVSTKFFEVAGFGRTNSTLVS